MIKLVDKSEERIPRPEERRNPVCPHCSRDIETIYMQEIRSVLGKRYLYYCSQCQKVLGISHRKGFWMG